MAKFIDCRSNQLPEFTAEVCIVGLGAAGATLATQLDAKGVETIVIEAGAENIESQTQDLYAMSQTGVPYYDMTSCRLRYLGGTTNHWGGFCRANDPIDYLGRRDLGIPAWPFDFEHIRPYFVEAATLLGLTEEGFDPYHQAAKRQVPKKQLLEEHSDLLTTKVFQISRNRNFFREVQIPKLATSGTADVLLNANVVHIQLSDDGRRVVKITAKTMNGRTFDIRAKRFVLAAHAVENARLLLASNDVAKDGIGNGSDHVGRYFMEHPHIHSGVMIPTGKFPGFYNYDQMRRVNLNANLGLTEKAMRAEGVLQYYCRFNPVYSREQTAEAIRDLKSSFWEPGDLDALKSLGELVSNVPDSLRFVQSRRSPEKAVPVLYNLEHRIEQSPNPSSRIQLLDEKDALGMRKAVLSWQLSDLDIMTFQRGQKVIVDELTRLGMGRFELSEIDRTLVESEVAGHYHHIGTTRMSTDATQGVVDADCRVHGVENLYVSGSGVFPTSGYSGPTMMIVAMAIRLSQHLHRQ
ncbi:GMC oxidoreductase [Haloferula sp.]|uniref:GMC oxidoreductase n=1 Tax=Haloferula sp. TaxID=2497595 RepID=UPI00329F815D